MLYRVEKEFEDNGSEETPENLGKSTAKALVGSEEPVIELSNFICPTK